MTYVNDKERAAVVKDGSPGCGVLQSSKTIEDSEDWGRKRFRRNKKGADRLLEVLMAGCTRLELATSGVTGRRSNQLS